MGHRPDSEAGCQSRFAFQHRTPPKVPWSPPAPGLQGPGWSLEWPEEGFVLNLQGTREPANTISGAGQGRPFRRGPFYVPQHPLWKLRIFYLLVLMSWCASCDQTARVLQDILLPFLPWLPGSSELTLGLRSYNPPLPTFLVLFSHFLHLWLLHFRELASRSGTRNESSV